LRKGFAAVSGLAGVREGRPVPLNSSARIAAALSTFPSDRKGGADPDSAQLDYLSIRTKIALRSPHQRSAALPATLSREKALE
ncbi:MAG: hypothetical protein ACXW2A_18370, partial [Burkholderiales bacterium]